MTILISSISGQIEAVAAEIMIEKSSIKRIDCKNFPSDIPLVDDIGRPVRFAVIFPNRKTEREFDALVEKLRA